MAALRSRSALPTHGLEAPTCAVAPWILQGKVQRYETFAGRSAMVGVAAATVIELVTEQGVLGSVTAESVVTYIAATAAAVATAIGIAFFRSRSDNVTDLGGLELLEPVYASLTAVRRSAASVTQAQVRGGALRVWTGGSVSARSGPANGSRTQCKAAPILTAYRTAAALVPFPS